MIPRRVWGERLTVFGSREETRKSSLGGHREKEFYSYGSNVMFRSKKSIPLEITDRFQNTSSEGRNFEGQRNWESGKTGWNRSSRWVRDQMTG